MPEATATTSMVSILNGALKSLIQKRQKKLFEILKGWVYNAEQFLDVSEKKTNAQVISGTFRVTQYIIKSRSKSYQQLITVLALNYLPFSDHPSSIWTTQINLE